jgi:hypothetical protein
MSTDDVRPDRFIAPGTPVRLTCHGKEGHEDGVVVHCWWDEEIASYDCYVAFFGDRIPAGRPSQIPYVLRYASVSLSEI